MFDIHLEAWETLSNEVKEWLPSLDQRKYPKLEGIPEVGKSYRLYPEGCISGNMEPYHGCLRVGAEKENLIVYFNGGGLSWNEYTAAHPNNIFCSNLKDRYYFNESEWIGDGVIDNGLASMRKDNPFKDWSLIEFPYATGDFHCGNGDFPYTALDNTKRILPHNGYRNTMAVLEMAIKWVGTPKRLLIAGSSAGGWGVSLMAEDVIRFFDGCEEITCLVDSSLMIKKDWKDIALNVWHAPEHICNRIHSDDLMLDSYAALYRTFGTKIKYLFTCSIKDIALIMMQSEFDGDGMTVDAKKGCIFHKRLKNLYDSMKKLIPGSGFYFFNIPTGMPEEDAMGLTQHTILESPLQFEYKVKGKTVSDWLWNAVCGGVEDIGVEFLN